MCHLNYRSSFLGGHLVSTFAFLWMFLNIEARVILKNQLHLMILPKCSPSPRVNSDIPGIAWKALQSTTPLAPEPHVCFLHQSLHSSHSNLAIPQIHHCHWPQGLCTHQSLCLLCFSTPAYLDIHKPCSPISSHISFSESYCDHPNLKFQPLSHTPLPFPVLVLSKLSWPSVILYHTITCFIVYLFPTLEGKFHEGRDFFLLCFIHFCFSSAWYL